MSSAVDLEHLRRRKVPARTIEILRLRMRGRTVREAAELLRLGRHRYREHYRRAEAILRDGMQAVEAEIAEAERTRVSDVREYLHYMHHDVLEETPIGPRWRQGAFGQPAGEMHTDEFGRPVVLRAKPWGLVAEDVLGS